jgi:predicted LPLAT superfamily acyltransferase
MRHCDDYINDITQPLALRKYLNHARSPAHGALLPEPHPKLYATLNGGRVRCVMASRLGDVGVTTNLATERGYSARVHIEQLTDFSDKE